MCVCVTSQARALVGAELLLQPRAELCKYFRCISSQLRGRAGSAAAYTGHRGTGAGSMEAGIGWAGNRRAKDHGLGYLGWAMVCGLLCGLPHGLGAMSWTMCRAALLGPRNGRGGAAVSSRPWPEQSQAD